MSAPEWALVAVFLWAECLDCVGLRTAVRWWRARKLAEGGK